MVAPVHQVRFSLLFLTPVVLGAVMLGQQTPTPTSAPPPGTVPVTSQTPAGPGIDPTAPASNAPQTKSEIKAQRKQQKHQEKSAKESARAQKDQANALKHQDKSVNEQEQIQAPK